MQVDLRCNASQLTIGPVIFVLSITNFNIPRLKVIVFFPTVIQLSLHLSLQKLRYELSVAGLVPLPHGLSRA